MDDRKVVMPEHAFTPPHPWPSLLLLSSFSCSLAAATCLLAGPRALAHHQWYLQKLDGYPRDRKALIPFLL